MIQNNHVKLIDFGISRLTLGHHLYNSDQYDDRPDYDFDFLKIFAGLKVFDPLSDEGFDRVSKGKYSERDILNIIESYKHV